jgi:hypothetical protein
VSCVGIAPVARHNPSKPKERRPRKRLKERETFLDEPALLAPTFQGQTRIRVQPCAIAAFNQSFFSGNILPKITRIVSGRCSPLEPSRV